jgi:hypothetical protein
MTTFKITVEDAGGHDGVANGGHFGLVSSIWSTSPSDCKIEITEDHHVYRPGRLSYHEDRVRIALECPEDCDVLQLVHYTSQLRPGYVRLDRISGSNYDHLLRHGTVEKTDELLYPVSTLKLWIQKEGFEQIFPSPCL